MQNNQDQIKTIYQISQILGEAFNQVNNLCAHFLADTSIDTKNNHKTINNKPQKQIKQNNNQLRKQEIKINYAQRSESQNQKYQPVQKNTHTNIQKSNQKNQQKPIKNIAHPEKPKQPLSAFFLFQSDQKENVKAMHPDAPITQISKILGQIWGGLNQEDKKPYVKKSQELKAKYEKEMKKFYDKHPEQKSKKQLKKQKAQNKNIGFLEITQLNKKLEVNSKAVQKKKPIVVEEQDQSN